MTATDAQVRIMMRERQKGKTQEQAAASANVRSRKTVAKYEGLHRMPSELKQRRRYRTRRDPFVEHWPEVETMLAGAPELEATALFEWLCEQHPGHYEAGQVRTFQRRVTDCGTASAASGRAGVRAGRSDADRRRLLTELGVTIQVRRWRICWSHCVLPYSNWEWAAWRNRSRSWRCARPCTPRSTSWAMSPVSSNRQLLGHAGCRR
jgi:hypothetical protein